MEPAPTDTFSRFRHILKQFQESPNLSNSVHANDEQAIASHTGEEKSPIRISKSATKISQNASDLIIASEICSRSIYIDRFSKPVWPKGLSGVTIGIGYDLGASTPSFFEEDWKPYIDASTLNRLIPACGVSGNDAGTLAIGLRNIQISWEQAIDQYHGETLPRYIGETERALSNTSLLSQDSLGALVSLVYNRGTPFRNPDSRFREMRSVSDHMSTKKFWPIVSDLRSMKRLWQNQPSFRGLVLRREAEAALFELGLDRTL